MPAQAGASDKAPSGKHIIFLELGSRDTDSQLTAQCSSLLFIQPESLEAVSETKRGGPRKLRLSKP